MGRRFVTLGAILCPVDSSRSILEDAAHVFAALVLSFPFDLNELLRSEPTTQLSLPSLKATPLTISGVIHWHELMES